MDRRAEKCPKGSKKKNKIKYLFYSSYIYIYWVKYLTRHWLREGHVKRYSISWFTSSSLPPITLSFIYIYTFVFPLLWSWKICHGIWYAHCHRKTIPIRNYDQPFSTIYHHSISYHTLCGLHYPFFFSFFFYPSHLILDSIFIHLLFTKKKSLKWTVFFDASKRMCYFIEHP